MVEEKEQYWADLLRGTLTMPNVKQHSGSIEVDTNRESSPKSGSFCRAQQWVTNELGQQC